jgi:hypothetical protein
VLAVLQGKEVDGLRGVVEQALLDRDMTGQRAEPDP